MDNLPREEKARGGAESASQRDDGEKCRGHRSSLPGSLRPAANPRLAARRPPTIDTQR
jgi:hypothetical protein